jgi:hypothetical protein
MYKIAQEFIPGPGARSATGSDSLSAVSLGKWKKNTLVTRRVSQLGHNEGFTTLATLYSVYYIISMGYLYFKGKIRVTI